MWGGKKRRGKGKERNRKTKRGGWRRMGRRGVFGGLMGAERLRKRKREILEVKTRSSA